MEPILFEQKESVGWLILNRPQQRNALTLELMTEMKKKLDQIAGMTEIRVVIIKGNGSMFCSGHDLKEMSSAHDLHHYRNIFSICSDMMETLHRLPQPVIAQVHGIATAAGCQLVAACDLAVAESGAKFSTPGVRIGLFCSTPSVPLCRVIGRRRALEMLLTGRFISAQEALEWGLVNRVVGLDDLEEETTTLAHELAQYSRFTLGFGKQTFYRQVEMDEASAYTHAKEAMVLNCFSDDAQGGIKAFLSKTKADWKDR